MPDQEAIQRGRDFEQRTASTLSGALQPGSGNKFYAKSDVSGHGLTTSCKSEKDFTWSKIYRHLLEAIELAYGTGDLPVLAIEDVDRNNDQLIIMKLSDFAKAFSEGIKIPDHSESKGIEKRKTAEIPLMLRN